MRAVIGKLTGRSLGGGSTITQQIAGTLYTDRTEITISRKIKELWWAIQMERRYSKDEILELYLNRIFFGGGTYGVSAASKYYFGHSAEEITPAEAAILVIQLSNPAYYNPFEHPNRAMERQQEVLRQMVELGYLTKEEAESSFDEYWLNFDYTRINSSAYFMRDDKAPWFSEYVRRELDSMMYGTLNIYTGGFTVNTTVNLKNQTAAQEIMTQKIAYANASYKGSSGDRRADANVYIPIVELLALTFDLPQLKVSEERIKIQTMSAYNKEINPVLDVLSLMFGLENLKEGVVNRVNAQVLQETGKNTVEGALISIENETGYITALVGGSKFDSSNQYIRATQGKLQPGSTFKPLYYSAAIDSRKFTPATIIYDTPVVFYNENGIPYLPQNFKGEWKGPVQMWYALAKSMNVPSLKVLDGIGFDAAMSRAAALLGISSQQELEEHNFQRVYPFALGVCSVSPIEMARAYAIFGNQGKEVTPIAIRSVEDRYGKVIMDPEKELRLEQKKKGSDIQIISPQNAYIMTDILSNSVSMGTLAYGSSWGSKFTFRDENGKKYTIPAAGKTGTTQNWADAWAVGYTPYITTAVWFGFDKAGQTLGTELTGSTLAGVAWGDYMQIAHEDLPMKEFVKPQTGLIRATVCSVSGLICTDACGNNKTTQYFLEGTQPTAICDLHINLIEAKNTAVERLKKEQYQSGVAVELIRDNQELELDMSFINSLLSGAGTTDTNDTPETAYPYHTENTVPGAAAGRPPYGGSQYAAGGSENSQQPQYNYLLD